MRQLLFATLLGLIQVCSGFASAQTAAQRNALATDLRDSIVEVRTTVVPGATSAEVLGPARQGSGVLIGPNLVVTIGYLILEADKVEVVGPDGRSTPVTRIGYDHATGFGILKTLLPIRGRPLELGSPELLREDEKVLTIGVGEEQATELSVLARQPFTGSWEYAIDRAIYTTPPVENWSGSALVDKQGKLVGVGSLLLRQAGTTMEPGNMFVPVDLLKPVLNDLVQNGRSKSPGRPWLGLSVEEVRGNVIVARVTRGGPAFAAGVREGDVLLGVGTGSNLRDVKDVRDYYDKLWATGEAGVEVSLRLLADRAAQTYKVKSIDRADFVRRQTVD